MKAVIFDLDGTLLDSMGMWRQTAAIYLKDLGIQAPEGLADNILKLTIRGAAEYLKKNYSLNLTVEQITRGLNGVMERGYARTIPPKAGAAELLEELFLHGYPMALATATDRYLIDMAFKRLGWQKYFSAICTCTEVGVGKRDGADVYETALKALGAEKSACWVFEDSPHAARTASAAGFNVVGIKDEGGGADFGEMKKYCKLCFESLVPARSVLTALQNLNN